MHLYWFLDATAYFYPATNASSQVYNIDFLTPSDQLTLPKHLARALRSALASSPPGAGPAQEAWACLAEDAASSARTPWCSDAFYAAWARARFLVPPTFSTALGLYPLYAAFALLCFSGPRRPRVGALATAALAFAATSLTGVALRAKWYAESVADGEGRRLTVRINGVFLAVVWGLVLASFLARVAVVASRGWVDGGWMQGLGLRNVDEDDDVSVLGADSEKAAWPGAVEEYEDEDVPQLGDLSKVESLVSV